jgi:flagellar operon protein
VKVDSKEAGKYFMVTPQPAQPLTRRREAGPAGDQVKPGGAGNSAKPAQSFGEILSAEYERSRGLKISAHAERRLQERNVVLDPEDMRKIEGAVHRAAAKGSRESLVIFGDLAMVASVRNRTIITAIQGKDMDDHVFTNIDSAVIVR